MYQKVAQHVKLLAFFYRYDSYDNSTNLGSTFCNRGCLVVQCMVLLATVRMETLTKYPYIYMDIFHYIANNQLYHHLSKQKKRQESCIFHIQAQRGQSTHSLQPKHLQPGNTSIGINTLNNIIHNCTTPPEKNIKNKTICRNLVKVICIRKVRMIMWMYTHNSCRTS
jgi:hypothetical protein